ncbi:MAG TPA: IS21 family transposase [Clostridiaceae bacterium]|nr:IS21 family transposase [Clostridiaceae bacterium]
MIRSGLINMIHEKAQKGKSAYTIGKELGISKNTAKKYMNQPKTTHGLKGRIRPSKLDPFKPQINEMVENGIFNCVVIFERLKDMGYTGGITIIKDYVKPFRPARNAPAVRRYETPPGKQAQMDWGVIHYIDERGITHKAPVFIMILSNSRCKYIEFAKRCDIYSLLRCMVNAFEYYGGVPEVVLTDRMKTVMNGSEAGKPIWNSRFEDFAADMGFVPKVCRVKRPQTKGKVERLVDYVKNNFLPGRQFKDLHDLNSQALEWCRKADSKIHGTTGEIPLEALNKEPLLPLPDKTVRDKYRWETRIVTRDGLVSYDGAKYGIPWQYSGREVRVRICGDFFEAYYGEVRIACHKVEYASGKIVWLKGQYQGLAEKGGIAMPLPFARKKETETVEIRSLSVYDTLAGVIFNG